MSDTDKSRKELLRELAELRQEITVLRTAKSDFLNTQLLALITDHIPALIAYLSPDERYIYVNEPYAKWFECSKEDIIGKHMSDVLPGPTYRHVHSRLLQALQGEAVSYEIIVENSRKQQRIVSVFYVPHSDEGGKIQAVVAMSFDITDRKSAEEALRESEERYRSLFNNNLYGALLTVPDGRILDANPSACRMFGMTLEEICKAGRDGLVDTSDPRLSALVKERELSGNAAGELTFVRKDGTRFPGEVSSAIFTDKDGTLRTSMIIQDITDRKRIEKALLESEANYRNLFETSNDGIVIVDLNGKIIDANTTAYQRLDYSREEFLALTVTGLDTPSFAQRIPERMNQILENGFAIFESAHLRKDGSIMPVELSARLFDYKGKKALLGIIRDITERKEAEIETKLHSEILRNMAEGVYLIRSADGTIVYANPTFERLFGYDSGELVGEHVSIVNAPGDKDSEEIAKEIIQTLRVKGVWQGEVENRKKNGTRFYCTASVSTFDHPKYGDVWVAVHQDISERKKMEEERENLINRLKYALAKVKLLSGLLPICSSCKKIRDDKGYWTQIEAYISEHSEAEFTHGICPACSKKLYGF